MQNQHYELTSETGWHRISILAILAIVIRRIANVISGPPDVRLSVYAADIEKGPCLDTCAGGDGDRSAGERPTAVLDDEVRQHEERELLVFRLQHLDGKTRRDDPRVAAPSNRIERTFWWV